MTNERGRKVNSKRGNEWTTKNKKKKKGCRMERK